MAVAWKYTPPKVNAIPRVHAAGVAGVRAAADILLEASRRKVPVDSGALRDSARVSQDGLEAAVAYGAEDDANTVAYAVVQHEHLEYAHPHGGEAKYLERPMHEEAEHVAAALAAALRKAL